MKHEIKMSNTASSKSSEATYYTEKVECEICAGYGYYWTAKNGFEYKLRCWCCHGTGKMFAVQREFLK